MKGVVRFFLLAFGFSWLLWVPLAIWRKSAKSSPWAIPFTLGVFGPSVAAAVLVQRGAQENRAAFWRRVVDPRGIGPWQWATALLLFPLAKVLIRPAARILQVDPPSLDPAAKVLSSPLSAASFAVTEFVGGPLCEEPGWRGYAQGQMEARLGRVKGSLLLGVIWTVWHLPLFFIPGTAQSEMGLWTPAFLRFLTRRVAESVLAGWVYSSSGGGTLAAILLHMTSNASITLISGFGESPDPTTDLVDTAVGTAAALAVASTWGQASR